MQLREAVQVAGGLPSGIGFIVSKVRSGLCHSEWKRRPHEDIAAVVCAKHRIDLRRVLRMNNKNRLSRNRTQNSEQEISAHANITFHQIYGGADGPRNTDANVANKGA